MSNIRIENDNRKEILNELESKVKIALTAIGMQAVTDIISKSDFPVDTGLLRNSITFALSGESPTTIDYKSNSKDKNEKPIEVKEGSYSGTAPNDKIPKVYIGTNVEYAKHVQFGVRGRTPRDFMFAPLRANIGHYKELMEAYLK